MPNVIIVEDEMLIAQATKLNLEKRGFTVIGIVAKEEALWQLLEKSTPDILLMDIMLKRKASGLELAKKVRESHDFPIIFTTGNQHSEIKDDVESIGSSSVMIKPVNPDMLVDEITSLLN